jgi:TM2 domain-containing protein/uncharacterized protein DUF4339
MTTSPARITVRHRDQNYGPYSLDEANRLIVSGQLSRDDLAWVEGTPSWTRLGLVPGTVDVPPMPGTVADGSSDRLILPAFLLAFFVGVFGVHRFYVGKTTSGIVMIILTCTVIGAVVTAIWSMIDWIMIICGAFEDREGRRLTRWT